MAVNMSDVFLTVISILIGAVLSLIVQQIYFRKADRQVAVRLSVDGQPVITDRAATEGLLVRHGESDVRNPHLLRAQVQNPSPADLLPSAFTEHPIRLGLPPAAMTY